MGAYAGFTPVEAHFAVSEVVVASVFGTLVILAYLALWRLRTSTPGGGGQLRVFKLPSGSKVSIPA